MQIKDIINHLDDNKREKLGELVRFAIVGVAAVLIQTCSLMALPATAT